jgi:hypothetical protein
MQFWVPHLLKVKSFVVFTGHETDHISHPYYPAQRSVKASQFLIGSCVESMKPTYLQYLWDPQRCWFNSYEISPRCTGAQLVPFMWSYFPPHMKVGLSRTIPSIFTWSQRCAVALGCLLSSCTIHLVSAAPGAPVSSSARTLYLSVYSACPPHLRRHRRRHPSSDVGTCTILDRSRRIFSPA